MLVTLIIAALAAGTMQIGLAASEATSSAPTMTLVVCGNGVATQVNGQLIGVTLSDEWIQFAYTLANETNWQSINPVFPTDNNFNQQWNAPAVGNYYFKATYHDDQTNSDVSKTLFVAVTGGENPGTWDTFSIDSNSTVSDATFRSDLRQLYFPGDGSANTGSVDVCMSTLTQLSIDALKVYADGKEVLYTSSQGSFSWIIHFTYPNTAKDITVSLDGTPPPSQSSMLILLIGIVVAVVVVVAVLLLVMKRRKRPESPNMTAQTSPPPPPL